MELGLLSPGLFQETPLLPGHKGEQLAGLRALALSLFPSCLYAAHDWPQRLQVGPNISLLFPAAFSGHPLAPALASPGMLTLH